MQPQWLKRYNSTRNRTLALSNEPDVFLLQQHCLTLGYVSKFDANFPAYQCIRVLGLWKCLRVLRQVFCTAVFGGGGVTILVRNHLRNYLC